MARDEYTKRNWDFWNNKKRKAEQKQTLKDRLQKVKEWSSENPLEAGLLGTAGVLGTIGAVRYGGAGIKKALSKTEGNVADKFATGWGNRLGKDKLWGKYQKELFSGVNPQKAKVDYDNAVQTLEKGIKNEPVERTVKINSDGSINATEVLKRTTPTTNETIVRQSKGEINPPPIENSPKLSEGIGNPPGKKQKETIVNQTIVTPAPKGSINTSPKQRRTTATTTKTTKTAEPTQPRTQDELIKEYSELGKQIAEATSKGDAAKAESLIARQKEVFNKTLGLMKSTTTVKTPKPKLDLETRVSEKYKQWDDKLQGELSDKERSRLENAKRRIRRSMARKYAQEELQSKPKTAGKTVRALSSLENPFEAWRATKININNNSDLKTKLKKLGINENFNINNNMTLFNTNLLFCSSISDFKRGKDKKKRRRRRDNPKGANTPERLNLDRPIEEMTDEEYKRYVTERRLSMKQAETPTRMYREVVAPTASLVREIRGTPRALLYLRELKGTPTRKRESDPLTTAVKIKRLLG
jgi:hypothetical protein